MKNKIFMGFGFIVSWIIQQMGGWSIPIQMLFWCIAIDSVSGYIVAGIFHKSPKTKNGKLYSREVFKGILKKFMYICIIIIGRQMDLVLNINYIANGLVFGFIALDVTSIIENMGLMGIKLPDVLAESLELLNKDKTGGRNIE